jgi:ubiquitin carboxyl-terminal hydrolase 5/13
MASIIQVLFAFPAFKQQYQPFALQRKHWTTCPASLPAECIDCQMYKLADGLLSGRYSHPSSVENPHSPLASNRSTANFQDGLKPSGFKNLIGQGHAEFSTMRQQDAEEFLSHLLSILRRQARKVSASNLQPTAAFAFGMEQRLQCGECKRVRYRVDPMDVVSVSVPSRELLRGDGEEMNWEEVTIEDCLNGITGREELEYACPACGKQVIASK